MRTRIFCLCLYMASAAPALAGTSGGTTNANYYPLDNGARWDYAVFNVKKNAPGNVLLQRYREVEVIYRGRIGSTTLIVRRKKDYLANKTDRNNRPIKSPQLLAAYDEIISDDGITVRSLADISCRHDSGSGGDDLFLERLRQASMTVVVHIMKNAPAWHMVLAKGKPNDFIFTYSHNGNRTEDRALITPANVIIVKRPLKAGASWTNGESTTRISGGETAVGVLSKQRWASALKLSAAHPLSYSLSYLEPNVGEVLLYGPADAPGWDMRVIELIDFKNATPPVK